MWNEGRDAMCNLPPGADSWTNCPWENGQTEQQEHEAWINSEALAEYNRCFNHEWTADEVRNQRAAVELLHTLVFSRPLPWETYRRYNRGQRKLGQQMLEDAYALQYDRWRGMQDSWEADHGA